MEAASDILEATSEAEGSGEVNALRDFSSLAAAASEKSKNEQAARDRGQRIAEETARCEKVLKDTSTGKQGRHK